MTHPQRYLFRMTGFLAAVAVGIALLYQGVSDSFMANPGLNGLIIGVLFLGIVYIYHTVTVLISDVAWLENFRAERAGVLADGRERTPRMLAPMAAMLGNGAEPFRMSPTAMRSLLDGIFSRLSESREISRYLIGLLIFLGLLGTFWGLLKTIGAVGDVIGGLTVEGSNMETVFTDLKAGLQSPMAGMATAFSSSLFGLAGSLVLGFLELQASQAQNRFANELEDWLSGEVRLGTGEARPAGEASIPAYIEALLEQTSDNLENLERTLQRGEEARISANAGIVELAEHIGVISEQMKLQQPLLSRLTEAQLEIKVVLDQMAALLSRPGFGDASEDIRGHLRSIDNHFARLLDDSVKGRAQMVEDLRGEIRVLSRTLAAAAEQARR